MSSKISLREWIERALESADIPRPANESFASLGPDSNAWSADIRRTLAVSSDSYLTSALRVARSLADQCCQADENNVRHQQLLPAPGTDWADPVVVHLSNEHQSIDDYKEDLEPLPFSWQNPSSESKELQALSKSTIHDESRFTRCDDEEGAFSGGASKVNIAPYNNVARAEFSLSANNKLGPHKGEMQRIYNLGIVFYELFSGGERPQKINTQTATDESTEKSGANEADVDKELYPHTLVGGLDLSGRLRFEEISDTGYIFENFDNNRETLDIAEENVMTRKKRATTVSSLSSISIEPLQRKGIPISLCNLIGNMIDAINGDLSGDEAYRAMPDVRSDLQLMLDKPNRFLYDMDCQKLAVTGLQLNDAVFGRDMDFSALQNSYRRSISGDNECGLIVGPSGIGKTALANRMGSFASAEGALFLKGKFDQLQQMTPFSALASALNEYCNQMFKEGRSSNLEEVASKLTKVVGKEAGHLVKVIPNLCVILGEGAGQDEGQDCANAQARFQYLLCAFVDVISRLSGAPIVLFLDDLQWSDEASLSAINQLLMFFRSSNPKRRFFFLGSCREEGLLEQHPFGSMLAKIRQFDVHATLVQLACFDRETTNTVVSDLLCLPPRLTRTLSDIVYHKSQGNPLFVSQLMISLCKDKLVRLSLSRRRWEWDEEKIQSIKLPDDISAFLSSTIERLPEEVQGALCTMSCFGSRFDRVLIESLEAKLDTPLIKSLETAVAKGVIYKVDGSYSFAHDKLQEAAYNLMQPEDRPCFHFRYGLALVHHALEVIDDDMLFTAVNQINIGGPASINDSAQAVQIASLNLTAGITAMEMSDFSSAYSFFDNGISFLRKRHWQEHYDLSLQLFEAASKCALVKGDEVSLKLVSDQILRFAKRFEDKLNTIFNNVTALCYKSHPESVKMATSVLSQLGIDLPEPVESDFKTNIERTKILLKGFTDQDLLEYKRMTDPSKIMAMKFLARLELSLQYTRPVAAPIVTMNIIRLSIDHGMSPVSPIGFTYFGQHVATCGYIKEGCRYVNLARKLMTRIGSTEFAGEVIAIGSQVLHFFEPIQLSRECHAEGYTIAMAAGDMPGAMFNSVFYCLLEFWFGTKLIVCKEHISRTFRLMEQHGHLNHLVHLIQMRENIQLLIGSNDGQDEMTMSNATTAQVEKILQNANHHGSIAFNFQKMFLHFMFREYEGMKVFAEQFYSVNVHNYVLHFPQAGQKFYGGLVAFRVYRQTNDYSWAERGRAAKVATKKWAELSHHNFQHRVYLLEAEEAFCDNDPISAQFLYEKAVSTAREHWYELRVDVFRGMSCFSQHNLMRSLSMPVPAS